MPLKIIRQDITKMKVDAIINPTNRYMEPGGGADLAIHEAAGPELYEYCQKLGGCPVGEAKITPAFNLPCKYIIHTAGPDWYRVDNPEELLVSCYQKCLSLAVTHNCESIGFPLISSGAYGYPKDKVLKVAIDVISEFLFDNELMVYLVVFDKRAYEISSKIFSNVLAYIDDNYIAEHCEQAIILNEEWYGEEKTNAYVQRDDIIERRNKALREIRNENHTSPYSLGQTSENSEKFSNIEATESLDAMIKNMDKGFAETLFYYIDKKGITDVECYKMSNVDKKTFSKIKCNKNYKPSKITAVSFAIGLKLDLDETDHLLNTVGMSLSQSKLFDVIIKYFITTGKYDTIFDVNEVLYKFDEELLGC